MNRINRRFFNRDARLVARDLLGIEIIRKIGSRTIRGIIVETEAYCGPYDKACHASRGRTPRVEPMYGPPGTIYVYFVYGMHFCINLVTGEKGYPAAVLLRAIKLSPSGMRINGPGNVTRALHITKYFNNKNILSGDRLMLGRKILKTGRIKRTARIGVSYAQEWASKRLRYLIE